MHFFQKKTFFQVENGNFLKVIFLFWAKMAISHADFCLEEDFTKIYITPSKIAKNFVSFLVSAKLLSNKHLLFQMFFDKHRTSWQNIQFHKNLCLEN